MKGLKFNCENWLNSTVNSGEENICRLEVMTTKTLKKQGTERKTKLKETHNCISRANGATRETEHEKEKRFEA